MNKSILKNFIYKYCIDDVIYGGVSWVFSDNALSAKFRVSNKSMIGIVKVFDDSFKQFNGMSFAVKSHDKIYQFLDATIGENCNISFDGTEKLNITAGRDIYSCRRLSDDSIRHIAEPKRALPNEWNIRIKITNDFVNEFLKFRYISKLRENFSIKFVGDVCKLFLYGEDSSIETQIDATKIGEIKPQFYNLNAFADALLVNKGVDTEFLISAEGVAPLQYKTNEYDAEYMFLSLDDSGTYE